MLRGGEIRLLDDDVDALRGTEPGPFLCAVLELPDPVGPRTDGAHHLASADLRRLSGDRVCHLHSPGPPRFQDEIGDLGVVDELRSVLVGALRRVDRQPSIIRERVIVFPRTEEPLLTDVGFELEHLVLRQHRVAALAPLPRRDVVEGEAEVEYALPVIVPLVHEVEEGPHLHQVRRRLDQLFALPQRLRNHMELVGLQISKAPVDQIR